jgi:hypothetical protein
MTMFSLGAYVSGPAESRLHAPGRGLSLNSQDGRCAQLRIGPIVTGMTSLTSTVKR